MMKASPKGPVWILIVASVIVLILGIVVGGTYFSFTRDEVPQGAIDETQNKVVVPEEEAKVEFKQTDKLPDNFPSDFPVYEAAKLEGYWTASGENIDGISAIWKTSDDPADLITFYKSELLKNGWEMATVFEDATSGTFTITKDTQEGFVGITKEGDTALISVTIGLSQ